MATDRKKTILVSGATGHQGGAVLRHLLERGFAVRALTRDPDKPGARSLQAPGIEVARGNFDDLQSLMRALDGAYGAYSVQDSTPGFETEVRQGIAFADAANRSGIEHFVYSSVASADRKTGLPHFESKARIEEHIRTTGMRHTILRPVFFMENLLGIRAGIEQGTFAMPLSPQRKLQMIAVDDIGAFAAMAFEHSGSWADRAMELAGDDLTMQEIAQALSLKTGQSVRYAQTPWDAFEKQMGKGMADMFHWFEREGYHVDLAAVRAHRPETLNFTQWLNKWWQLAHRTA
jgi:uncharacterized protein YbjT (DUF2867 family)